MKKFLFVMAILAVHHLGASFTADESDVTCGTAFHKQGGGYQRRASFDDYVEKIIDIYKYFNKNNLGEECTFLIYNQIGDILSTNYSKGKGLTQKGLDLLNDEFYIESFRSADIQDQIDQLTHQPLTKETPKTLKLLLAIQGMVNKYDTAKTIVQTDSSAASDLSNQLINQSGGMAVR